MMIYEHFLITRFNLNFGWKDKSGNETCTNEWLDNRFVLFEKYCLPSVMNQTVVDFSWLILFDQETPQPFLDKIKKYQQDFKNIAPIYIPSPPNFEKLQQTIESRLSQAHEYVITTRIDNDDAIHKNHLKEVRNLFDHQWDTFIRFLNGYQFIENKNTISKMQMIAGNHFSSRIESIKKGVDTVIAVDNTLISSVKDAQILDIDDRKKRLWMEVVHKKNVANHERRLEPIFDQRVILDFNLKVEIDLKNSFRSLTSYILHKTHLSNYTDRMKRIISRILLILKIKQ